MKMHSRYRLKVRPMKIPYFFNILLVNLTDWPTVQDSSARHGTNDQSFSRPRRPNRRQIWSTGMVRFWFVRHPGIFRLTRHSIFSRRVPDWSARRCLKMDFGPGPIGPFLPLDVSFLFLRPHVRRHSALGSQSPIRYFKEKGKIPGWDVSAN